MNPPSVMIGPKATPFVAVTLEMITQRGEYRDEDRIVLRPDLCERCVLLFGGGLVAAHPDILSGQRTGEHRRQLSATTG